jgi:hypothetical protein
MTEQEIKNLIQNLMNKYREQSVQFKKSKDNDNRMYFIGGERALYDLLQVIKRPELFVSLIHESNSNKEES